MSRRTTPSIVGAVLAAITIAACSPMDSPTAIPTYTEGTAAFAAAEATYRDYVDALNSLDMRDPATAEPLYAVTTGDRNAWARSWFSARHEDGDDIVGSLAFDGFVGRTFSPLDADAFVVADVCFDQTGFDIVDAEGVTLLDGPLGREPERVTFVRTGYTTGMSVAVTEEASSDVCG